MDDTERQRRNDGDDLAPGVRDPRGSGGHHEYTQCWHRTGWNPSVAGGAPWSATLGIASRGRDVRRRPQRHQRVSCKIRACDRRFELGHSRPGARGRSGGRYGDGLPSVQGRNRHLIAPAGSNRRRLHCWRSRPVQLRFETASANCRSAGGSGDHRPPAVCGERGQDDSPASQAVRCFSYAGD
jgi:hypothetical protein